MIRFFSAALAAGILAGCAGTASEDAQRRWRNSYCAQTYGQNCPDENGPISGPPDHNQPIQTPKSR